jgi:crotonobetainyl-CoA:carnitine CoA-transferase CaiB-like acyl-CoA transferase
VFNDPQVKYRKLKINMINKNAKKGYTQSIRTPILFSDIELDYSRGVPMLGEHNNEILKELDNES